MKKKGLLIFLMGMVCTYIFSNTPPYLISPQNEAPINSNATFEWVSNDALRNHELKIYNCNYDAGSYSKSLNLSEYELIIVNDRTVGRDKAISGLAFANEKRKLLVACSSELKQIDSYALGTSSGTYSWITAAFPEAAAYGGITHLSSGDYVLAEDIDRFNSYIYYMQYEPLPGLFITPERTVSYKINLGSIEGISFDPVNNKLYVAQEKSPIALYELNAFKAPNFQGTVSLSKPFDMAKAAQKWGVRSVNGLYHLGQDIGLNGTETSEHLLVLSAESNVVIETDMNGNEISRLNLNVGGANGSLTEALADANGIAYFNGAIYIATQSDVSIGRQAKLYMFRNTNHKNPTVDLGSRVFSKKGISGSSYNSVPNSTFTDDKTYCWEIIGTTNDGGTVKSTIFSFKAGNPILGCTDRNACNYKSNATQDDNSCEYESCKPVISALSSPSLGQQFYPGDVINIKWVDNFPENVSIILESPNVKRTISSSTASDGSYNYTLPSDIQPASNYRILIQKRDETSVKLYSANFTVLDELGINVYSPTAQSRHQIGGKVSVRWEHNLTGSFDVSLYKGNSLIASVVKNRTTSNFDYTIPSNFDEGDNYRFKIKSNSSNVSVYSPYITFYKVDTLQYDVEVTAPVANAIYNMGANVTIRWNKNFSEPVDIFLFKNRKYVQDIAKNVAGNSLNYRFNNLKQGNDYQIYIRSTIRLTTDDYSSNFTLLETSISVSSPFAGNTYNSSNYISVRWADVSSRNVSIKLYNDNVFVMTVAASVPNNGSYDFKTPNVNPGEKYKVVVTSLDNSSKKGSSGFFNIVLNDEISNIVLQNGSLGTNREYLNDDEFNVTWRDRVAGRVTIQLFKDGRLIRSLAVRTSSDGYEKVMLTGNELPYDDNYKIKVYSVGDHSIFDFSNSFSIVDRNGNKAIQSDEAMDIGPLYLYPNPTKGSVIIDVPTAINNSKQIQLRVFDLFGRTIFENKYIDFKGEQIKLDLTDIVEGVYFIHLNDVKSSFQSKIVID